MNYSWDFRGYCESCGLYRSKETPSGDNRERLVCESCGTIHYENPKVVAGCIPLLEDDDNPMYLLPDDPRRFYSILLGRRNTEPRKGFWTFPAGFMEMNESLEEAAARESMEEFGIELINLKINKIISSVESNQVHVIFTSWMDGNKFVLGNEISEARFFKIHEIPWDDLAFGVTYTALKNVLEPRSFYTEVWGKS